MENVPLWDDKRWTPLPRLEGEATADVCVVGLGGTGLACADELISLGLHVVGLEASSVASGGKSRRLDTISQKARSRSQRRSGGLPAMMAELMAPMEMPATQSGVWPASASASKAPAW